MPDQHKATIPFTRNHIFDRNLNALKSTKTILSIDLYQYLWHKRMYFTDDVFILLTGKPAFGKRREKRQFVAGIVFFLICHELVQASLPQLSFNFICFLLRFLLLKLCMGSKVIKVLWFQPKQNLAPQYLMHWYIFGQLWGYFEK